MAHIKPRKLKSGDKAYQVRWIDAAGKERSRQFDLMRQAKAFKAEIEQALMRGTYVDPRAGDITVRRYGEQWRADRVDHRPNTAAKAEMLLRLHVYPAIGDLRLGAARRSDIQRFIRHLDATELSPATVHGIIDLTRSIFAAAVENHIITVNPCKGVVLPELDDVEVIIPTTEQVAQMASVFSRSPWYSRIVLGAAGTGMRSGELRGLTKDRVDWLKRNVTVDRQMVDVIKGRPVFGPPKTKASKRVIPVSQSVIDVLARQLHERGEGPEGLIFTGRDKTPLTAAAMGNTLNRWFDRLDWPTGTGLHVFRHYYASLLIHKGLSVKVVQKRLGHATAQETLDTYGHLWPDDEEDSRTAVEEVLGAIISEGTASPSGVRGSVKSSSPESTRLTQRACQSSSPQQAAE